MESEKAASIIEEVFGLYEKYGSSDYIGEPVSQIEHMCQAAALAEKEGYDDEVVLAAFFHDIGHLCEHILPVRLMDGLGVMDHERLGAGYLRDKGFSERLTSLVQSHVAAKRYLTYKFPDYYDKLSSASKITLEKQGGVMNEREAQAFEKEEWHNLFIKLREWDDLAKMEHLPLPSLDRYREMAYRHLLNRS
ncbi:MAG: HD domain-containing protein [Terrimonas sp.]|nr:HD domain-containing protein [Terrimonas sp.]